MLKAVIFDMDGVLIDSTPAVMKATDEVLRPYGFGLKDLKAYHHAHSLKMVIQTVAQERHIQLDFEKLAHQLRIQILDQLKHVQIDPELSNLLKSLQAHNIRLAVASSALRGSVEGKLSILDLQDTFRAVLSGDDVENHKPAPDIYLKAAQELGIKPENCIVIEDNEIGAKAGHRAGMKVVGFNKYNDDPKASFGADTHTSNWSELSYETLKNLLK